MNQVRSARWRAGAALLAALALVAAACGGSDDDESADDPTTTIDVEVDDTTTSTTPATTTTLSEADRFRTIAVDLWTARNDLYQNPPADLETALAEIVDRDCSCLAAERADLDDLASRGLRYDGSPAMPLGTRFGDFDAEARIAGVQLALDATPRNLVSAEGTAVKERTGGDPYAMTLGLVEREGRWLISAIVVLDVDEAFVDELIAEGLA